MDTLYISRPSLEEPFVRMLDSSETPRVLNLHSKLEGQPVGGMGKSRMLERYSEICKEKDITHTRIHDFRLTGNQSRTAIIQTMIECQPRLPFEDYREKRQALIREKLQSQSGAMEGAFDVLEQEVDQAWLNGMEQVLKSKFVVFIDSWELVKESNVGSWLEQQLNQLENMNNLCLVIAGRTPLKWNRTDITELQVKRFNESETTEYLENRLDPNSISSVSGLGYQVHEATQGHPVLIAWAMDLECQGLIKVESLLEEWEDSDAPFASLLAEESSNQPIPLLAWSALLHRRFNIDILHLVTGWDEEECKAKIELLRQDFPTITRRGSESISCEPHDAVRDVLTEFRWPQIDRSGDMRKALRQEVINYYEEEIQKGPPTPLDLQLIHEYMTERLYYIFDNCHIEYKGQSGSLQRCLESVFDEEFVKNFDHALRSYQLGLARSLLREVSEFDELFDPSLKLKYQIAQARLLAREGRTTDALSLYKEIKSQITDEEHLADLELKMGRCYYLEGMYIKAESAYSNASFVFEKLHILSRKSDALRYRGMALRGLGRFKEAYNSHIESFLTASALAETAKDSKAKNRAIRRIASASNQAAQIAIMSGRTPEARGWARKALRLWQQTQSLVGQAEAQITLGRIAEMEGEFLFASRYLREAIEMFSQGTVPSPYGEARAKMFLARVRRRQEQIGRAESLTKMALEVFTRLGRRQQIAFALSELGTILREREYYYEAEMKFNEAWEVAKDINDFYRQVEVLEDLSLLMLMQENYADAEDYLAQVESLTCKREHKLFLGRVYEHRGQMTYKRDDFVTAFDYFARACHTLARYHLDFYRRFLNNVENRLYELAEGQPELAIKSCEVLISYWQEHKLEADYPDLIRRVKAARDLIDFWMRGSYNA